MTSMDWAGKVLQQKIEYCEERISARAEPLADAKRKYERLQAEQDEWVEVIASCKAALELLPDDVPTEVDLTGKIMMVAEGTPNYTAGRLVKVVERHATQKDMWRVVFQDIGTDTYLSTAEMAPRPEAVRMWKAGDPVMVRRNDDNNIPLVGAGRFADVVGYVKLEEGVVRIRFASGDIASGDIGEYHETNLESRA